MRDVIVVGGGPAGSAVACHLARQGWDVLLLDRAQFPRDKPCGEFLTPAVRPLLENLGVWRELIEEGLVHVPATRLFSASGRFVEYVPEDAAPAGFAVRRTVLDRVLLNAARASGAEVREGCSVSSLLWEDGRLAGVRLRERPGAAEIRDRRCTACSGGPVCPPCNEQDIRARLVIGADGTHSIVARTLGLVRPLPRLQRIAIVSHWAGVRDVDAIEMRSAGGLVCGLGPLGGDQTNVTVVARTSEAARIAGRPGEYLTEAIAETFPDLSERLSHAEPESVVRTVGCFGHVTKRASAPGAMLIGDAAAFVDPFTGEGVYFAVRGAELAAEVAHRCLASSDFSAEALYAYEGLRRELRQRYLLCGIVQAVVRTPPLMERLVSRCGREPLTLSRLMEVLGDLAPPARVLRPAFAAELFR